MAMKSPSQIITAFTQANQEQQLASYKLQFDDMITKLKHRRSHIESKQGIKTSIAAPAVTSASKAEKFKTMDEHRIILSALEQRLGTDLEFGLTSEQVDEKIRTIGKNKLTEKKKTPWYFQLLHEFTGFFAYLLWASGILSFIAYGLDTSDPSNLYLGIVLIAVLVFSGTVTYFQNAKSEAIMEAFKNFIPPETTVIRNKTQQKLQAENLVPGDIVIIEYGKRIPADLRILESNEMKVDNSSLTGESILLIRTIECTSPDNPLETKNLAFFGTLCKEGNGKGVVINTADRTIIGQIANLAASAHSDITTLRKELNRFIKIIAIIAISTGMLFLVLGFATGSDTITVIVCSIAIIVANAPEGLMATFTVALSITAKRLSQRKVLVKNLESVETLGSTSCICSDKTGTLTQNKMTVEHLWYNGVNLKGDNKQKMGPKYPYQYDTKEIGFRKLQICAMVCSEAQFDTALPQEQQLKILNNEAFTREQKEAKLNQAVQEWEQNLGKISWLDRPTMGDASETALIKFFQPIQPIEATRAERQVIIDNEKKPARMPFNSVNKYAFVIVAEETVDSFFCLYTKGAPERIWGLCDKVYKNGVSQLKDSQWEANFKQVNESFGKQGERVLGFSSSHLPKSQYPKDYNFNLNNMNFAFNQQTFIGLISVVDPPRDNVPYAVLKCKAANIQVIMVTGDQPVTATAIARQCNIITEKTANEIAEEEGISLEEASRRSNAIVIHGDLITKITIDEEGLPESEKGRQLSDWLSKPQVVFARTSPAQKLIIVEGCQKLGHIVAVTGDGVNDSPAIKKADIGIAMGIAGSDVAKDAADMVLLSDDFSAIVVGIEEGRKIFDNLKKTIMYIFVSNVGEIVPFMGYIICQFPLPLSTVLVLCIDLGTDMNPSTMYVFEDAELDVMTRKPRNSEEHLLSGKLLVFTYLQGGWFEAFGGFLQWFILLSDFGFVSSQLFGMTRLQGIKPFVTDYYQPESPWFGNSKVKEDYIKRGGECDPNDTSLFEPIDWVYRKHDIYDLRQMLLECGEDRQYKIQQYLLYQRWRQIVEWGTCKVNQISPITQRPVCYTTEAFRYGHTGFFYAIVWMQICNWFCCKAQKISLLYSGMYNSYMYFGFTTEIILIVCLAYIIPLNVAFGTRDVIFVHFGVLSMPFGLILIIWNEARRFLIRNYPQTVKSMPNWWERNVMV